ncbi:uncharacterized protein ACLA_016260 [Aspergillus clavatus NRRL 1]|uniref:Uncharacterized protein n=1 Tax=Aspergillus clavatus (strain ATCC 1007 / CBS 513.65 / DSM 816 / NCTC 3887 / NRRL 1 / QM 1276 / 107) TaxID=344612 RepID=A1CBR2_ASPCL|nr:uncharacterized protein ACLA_016260 [Aspergillus clavatus NRRL 1]EAW13180.1 hypothetical protein ACLA_016260 [Aspergillus clavatus NRRL 1]
MDHGSWIMNHLRHPFELAVDTKSESAPDPNGDYNGHRNGEGNLIPLAKAEYLVSTFHSAESLDDMLHELGDDLKKEFRKFAAKTRRGQRNDATVLDVFRPSRLQGLRDSGHVHFGLGDALQSAGLKKREGKIEVIKKLEYPSNAAQLEAGLGLFGYYRKYCLGYSYVVELKSV